jgi:integral membrane protein
LQPKQLFGFVATGEALTWALLIGAIVWRAIADSAIAVTVAGSIHGAMFLGYCVVATLVGINQRWRLGRMVSAVSLAIVPFATVPFDRKLKRENALDGSWRTETDGSANDTRAIDRMFRWFIARPTLLVLSILLFLVSLFSFLLYLGPPYEWFD